MRSILALAVVLGCGRTTLATPPPDVRVWESRDSSHISEGETTLDVDPDVAYAAAIDYPMWSSIFPDIVQVDVTKQQGVDARVTLVHHAGNRDNVHFHNQPGARMVWFEDTGGRAEVWAEIVFAPGDRAGTTRVHSRLFADVHGIASLVMTNRKLRSLREDRIASDLSHLHTYFAAKHIASR
jgi:hypothetical protein